MGYVELHCHSAYSFLDGASLPEELAARAAELGYEALALTDHDGVYGSLEFAHAAKHLGVRPITGAEVTLADGAHVTLLVESSRGYANLCHILTEAHAGTRRPGREEREPLPPAVEQAIVEEHADGLVCLSGCARRGLAVHDPNAAARLAGAFGRDHFLIELQRPFERGDARRTIALRDLAEHLGVDTIVTGNVHAHAPRRTLLQDALVAIRCRTSLDGCEQERRGNRESVLRAPAEIADRFAGIDPNAVARTVALAERLEFDLTEELGYRYPDFSDGAEPAIRQLAEICADAFSERYPPSDTVLLARARARLESELALIDKLELAGFFLLHWEVLELARECALQVRGPGSPRRFLPPGRGRGSSVGSIVCYLTGLSHVDPVANDLSLGRFLNHELASVPDIDLDFPRDIREKLIVAVTERYGHEHAALVASFATYRSRGAIRDIGKALGLPQAELERLARVTDGWDASRVAGEVAALPDADRKLMSRRWRAFQFLAAEIAGLPRHISQHPGGMVISSRPLVDLVPVQPAAMAGRQMCQWDKDSCADAGFLKIDLLGLGMLSAVEECVEQIARVMRLADRPLPDSSRRRRRVRARSSGRTRSGTFQIESRAQMQSLLRTRPETIDDLTVQVALVRPGPIQGKAVHPYIEQRRAAARGPVIRPARRPRVTARAAAATLGVVVFQDQVLDVAIALAGFTVGEAEGLRRAMSRKRSRAALESYRVRFVEGAVGKGVECRTADRVYDKLVGFSGFGFPKSHAAAFGLLAYQSQWLRHHYPAEFLCCAPERAADGLLSACEPRARCAAAWGRSAIARHQPEHGVVLARARRRLECGVQSPLARQLVRIGLAYVQSVGEDDAVALVDERDANGPYLDVGNLARRAPISGDGLVALVEGGACDSFGKRRRDVLWELGLARRPRSVPGTQGAAKQLTLGLAPTAATPALRDLTRWERMLADYRLTGLSVGIHPLVLLRPHLPQGTLSSAELHDAAHGAHVAYAGLAIARQRPATAKGIVFMLLEDEHGQVNLIVPSQVYERHRAIVRGESLLLIGGRYERVGENRNVVVDSLETLGPLARRVADADVGEALPRAHHFGHR